MTSPLQDLMEERRELRAENARLCEALEKVVKDLKARHFDCLDVCPERNVYAIARKALKETI